MRQPTNRLRASATALLAASASVLLAAGAMPIPVNEAPLDRVLPNLEARLAANPDDADAHYVLGRAHALGYVARKDIIRGYELMERFEPLPPDARDWMWEGQARPEAKPLTPDEASAHLRHAVKHLTDALRIERQPRYYLALASVLETAGKACLDLDPTQIVAPNPYGPGIHIPPNPDGSSRDPYALALPGADAERVTRARMLGGTLDPAQYLGSCDGNTVKTVWERKHDPNAEVQRVVTGILTDFWFEQTLDAYFLAHALALATEAKVDDRAGGSGALRISVEAGEGFLRVACTRPDYPGDATRNALVEVAVRELSKQQQSGGITPIVFSLERAGALADLLLNDRHVTFDLDGTGLPQRWAWVKPATGILVWDPQRTGRVASGRQLFGSVTWWLMFRDGYEALASLDDNRDGELAGAELTGIATWFDADSDGISDEGEINPLSHFGIVSVSVRPTGRDGAAPMSNDGLRLADGRVLPTFDWIAEPAPRMPAESPVVPTP